MDNLIFSLEVTMPIFLTMMLGFFFKKIHLFDDHFVTLMNRFVFKICLPALLFEDISEIDIMHNWDTTFVLYCFLATVGCILISFFLSLALKDKSKRGEYIQSSYRSSAAILGIAFIQNIYGDAGMSGLMIVASVPLYNIMAVIVLCFFHPEHHNISKEMLKKTGINILKNPIILGILVGILWSLTDLSQPIILQKCVHNLAVLATPLGLMSLGAAIEFNKIKDDIKPCLAATFSKLILFVAIFLPIAIALGFRQEKLIAILVMLGSATTVTSFVMAKNMGHDGALSSHVVLFTTLGSAFTLTMWLFILKNLMYI